ncbi:MAG: SAM-dependent methyltransferase [bacterium]|nr:SAM-dependent methyltransferase [bacterium]
MALNYKNIVPWGRNYDEYRRMFDLKDNRASILGCGDGPSSFNEEYTRKGGRVVSIDPIYKLSREEIEERIEETRADVLEQTEKNKEKFVWSEIRSIEELDKIRMKAMKIFLNSYDEGKKNRRYVPASLPDLPFNDDEFDISLSSHFLFLYTDKLTYEFHKKAITEMLRVSGEVRIFPLLDMNANRSSYVSNVLTDFKKNSIEIRKVNYEFQIGGNKLLIIKRNRVKT